MVKFSQGMRLKQAIDYDKVFQRAKRSSYGGLIVLTAANSIGHPRLGLAIAKKHLKLATQRNQLKRLIRTSFQQHYTTLSAIDIVVLSRTDIQQRDKQQIWYALAKHWRYVEKQWQKV